MAFELIEGITDLVNRDIDRVKRSLGVTPYRWRVAFIDTEEVAEREKAFGSPERAFYDLQGFLMTRIKNKTSRTMDMVAVTIVNARTGVVLTSVANRKIAPGQKYMLGHFVAEPLGYEV